MMLYCREPHSSGSTVIHLVQVIVMTNDDVSDIQHCFESFCREVNLFCARFGHLPVIIRHKLFQSFCFPFYGSQLWDLRNKELQHLETAWRKTIRRACNFPYRTHSAILPFLTDGNDFQALLCNRFYTFAHSCLFSVNMRVAFISLITCNSSMHNFGNNLLLITYSLKNVAISPTASVVSELLFTKHNMFTSILSGDERFVFVKSYILCIIVLVL